MVTDLHVYFEGDRALREGLREFLKELYEAASASSAMTRLIPARGTPVDRFKIALQQNPNALNILLLDSEGPAGGKVYKERLEEIPEEARGCVFWMVQIMESWFLADPDALARFYKQGFGRNLFKQWNDVEAVPKADVETILHDATQQTKSGRYHKTAHAPRLLKLIDPDRVRQKSAHCREMFDRVPAMLLQP
ncbi:MAG: DUF4276 family protein [Bryobacteraceae bacterium]